jgi:Holliday junction resolvase RusA-like endonuclease
MKKTTLFFPFEPVPKGRPRFTRMGCTYTPKATKDYETKISDYYRENSKDFYEIAIRIQLTFYMPIPKSASKKNRTLMESGSIKHTKKPDTDNLCKAFTDALNGIAYKDDSLITTLHVCKKYASDNNVGIEMNILEDVE